MRTAVVFVGGPHRRPPAAGTHPGLVGRRADRVVAVDSGLHLARSHGWQVDVVVGDMDSIDPGELADAAAQGVLVQRHPVDKDATDLELALDLLLDDGVGAVEVIAADGGRMDHLVGGLLTLCAPRFAPLGLRVWLGSTLVVPVHDRVRIDAAVGQVVSLLPVHGPAVGVRTDGLRWPLRGERLEPGTSRGVSNEMVAEVAEVSLDEGHLAVVVPQEEQQ
jgi:thiamine pyrophosphokinase